MPLPVLSTLSVRAFKLKVAVQDLFAVIVTTPSKQSASPLQPANVEPEAGIAVRDTKVPEEYVSEQSVPQLIPKGLLVMVPLPLPPLLNPDAMFTVRA